METYSDLWSYLSSTPKPIVIYGMGNGAEKLLEICKERNIPVSGLFASNDHARGNDFHGFTVKRYHDMTEEFEDFIILLAFGTYDETVLSFMKELSEKHEIYAPDLPLFGGPVIDQSFMEIHQNDIKTARETLADEWSKTVFDASLQFKLSGNIPVIQAVETERSEDYQLLELTSDEDYLDLGAYTGDTIDEFLNSVGGSYHSITALEPDRHNADRLLKNTAELHRVTVLPYASWNEHAYLTFTGKGGRNCAIRPELPGKYTHIHEVEAITVDSLNLPFSFIKMDVEGAEAETLDGLMETVRRYHPKLFVSAYHKTDDFINLILQINELEPGYRIYMRHNRCLPAWELQLYCIYKNTAQD